MGADNLWSSLSRGSEFPHAFGPTPPPQVEALGRGMAHVRGDSRVVQPSAIGKGGGGGQGLGTGQGCVGREGASEAAPEAVRHAVGGGCRSGWGRLMSVTNAVEAGTWRQGDSGWA